MLKVSLVLLLAGIASIGCVGSVTLHCPANRFFPKALKEYAHLGSDYDRAVLKSVCPGTGIVTCDRTVGGVTTVDFWDGVSVVELIPGRQDISCRCVDDASLNCAAEFEVWKSENKNNLNVGGFTELGTVNNEFNDIEGSFVVCPSVALGNNGGRNVVISAETQAATFPDANGGADVTVSVGDYVLQRMDAAPGVTNSDLDSLTCGTLECEAMDEDNNDVGTGLPLAYSFQVPIGDHVPVSDEVFWVLPAVGTKWAVTCGCNCASSGSLQWAPRSTACAKLWWIEKKPF